MIIEFYTVDAGWMTGEIKTGQKSVYFFYSWISNFLNDFLKASLYVGGYIEDINLGKLTAYSEPSIEDWLLTKEDEHLIIHIDCFEDETRKTLKSSTEIKCKYKEFLQSLFDALTKLINKIGIYGYRTEWNEEFPLSLYLKLYDVVFDTKFLDLRELSAEETYGRGGEASDIYEELFLLNRIINGTDL